MMRFQSEDSASTVNRDNVTEPRRRGMLPLCTRGLTPPLARRATATVRSEAAHLWQFQHGGIDYIKESLKDQAQQGSGAYDYEADVLAGKPWHELGPEQQANLIEEAYEQGYFDANGRGTFKINGKDATAYLEEALRQIRGGYGSPGGPPLVS